MNNHHNKKMPRWAQRIDDYGKNHWDSDLARKKKNGEYIANIIFNVIFLWIVNKIPEWHLDFIKDNFMVVLWILNVNIIIQIGGNALMLAAGAPAVRYLSRIIMEAASFVTQLVLFYIFPFDFTNFHGLSWLNWLLPIGLIIGMVMSALKVISNFWKLLFRLS